MRILYHHRIRSRDGQTVHLEELIEAMRALGHEVLLVGPKGFDQAAFGHEPKLLHFIKRTLPASIYEFLEIGYNLPAYMRLWRASRKFRPDFVYERYNLYLLAGIWLRRSVGVPILLEVNAPLAQERSSFGGLTLKRVGSYLERWVWRNADAVLPVTEILAQDIALAGVSRERICVIANAIEPEAFGRAPNGRIVKQELGLADKVVLGFTGFVRAWHGLDMVVDMLANPESPKELHFLVVGDGPAIPQVKSRAEEKGVLDRITFAGLIERNAIARYVSAFDIALLPRCVEYCSPLKLFEYMALGKAIAAPDQANIREVLNDDQSARLFAPDQPEKIQEAILELARSENLRCRLGRAAKALIDARDYTWRGNAKRVVAIGGALSERRWAMSRKPK